MNIDADERPKIRKWCSKWKCGLRECSDGGGAVFIVSPDGSRHPNENVMIELGLVAGRMGRARVALCVCGDVALPSDLLPVTRIDMNGTLPIENAAIERLTAWAKPIPEILNSVSCADVLHGNSGR